MSKQLVNLTQFAPGSFGLNKQNQNNFLPLEWATQLTNFVIGPTGNITSRKGTKRAHTNNISTTNTPVKTVFEYIDSSANRLIIFSAGNKIYKLVGNTVTDITGTITTPTDDHWKFQNFNGKCVGFQSGHNPIVLSSISGSFTNITLSGTLQPTTSVNEVLSAFGRLWVLDGNKLKYSDALDETSWNSQFDLSTVWINGSDEGVALAEFNGYLVIFGKKSIIIYNNPWNPSGGGTLDTTAMTLVENIEGIGCIARDSVQSIGTDLFFLSSSGVRSLGRTIQEKSLPLNDISKNNKDYLMNYIPQDIKEIKSVYNPKEGFYLLSIPTSSKVFCFDTKSFLQDGSARITEWDAQHYSYFSTLDRKLYVGKLDWLTEYSDYRDDLNNDGTGGTPYLAEYKSGWHPINEELVSFTKILKRLSVIASGGNGKILTFFWSFDFGDSSRSQGIPIPIDNIAEYNIAEYNISEYSGNPTQNVIISSPSGLGQFIRIGFSIEIDGREFSLQRVNLQAKVGKLVA